MYPYNAEQKADLITCHIQVMYENIQKFKAALKQPLMRIDRWDDKQENWQNWLDLLNSIESEIVGLNGGVPQPFPL